eukprot:TRINITY_DN489_c0_g1_i1.p1 TRINITY_DN489_c0_g1~~TRINITY_DN489_c0_g1_i1.p1  ORF type:complete len:704 (+),score=221.52 TRINITY_DN489_c0_g1_i1:128-2239(+)
MHRVPPTNLHHLDSEHPAIDLSDLSASQLRRIRLERGFRILLDHIESSSSHRLDSFDRGSHVQVGQIHVGRGRSTMEHQPLVEDRYDWSLLANEREKIRRELQDIEDREQQAQMKLETLFPRTANPPSQHPPSLEWERTSEAHYGSAWPEEYSLKLAETASLSSSSSSSRRKRIPAHDIRHDYDVDSVDHVGDREEGGHSVSHNARELRDKPQRHGRMDEEYQENKGEEGEGEGKEKEERLSRDEGSFERRMDEHSGRHFSKSLVYKSGRASEQLDEFWRKESDCWEGTDHRTHTFLLEQENSRIRESLKFLKEEEDAIERRLDRCLGPVALASTRMPPVTLRSPALSRFQDMTVINSPISTIRSPSIVRAEDVVDTETIRQLRQRKYDLERELASLKQMDVHVKNASQEPSEEMTERMRAEWEEQQHQRRQNPRRPPSSRKKLSDSVRSHRSEIDRLESETRHAELTALLDQLKQGLDELQHQDRDTLRGGDQRKERDAAPVAARRDVEENLPTRRKLLPDDEAEILSRADKRAREHHEQQHMGKLHDAEELRDDDLGYADDGDGDDNDDDDDDDAKEFGGEHRKEVYDYDDQPSHKHDPATRIGISVEEEQDSDEEDDEEFRKAFIKSPKRPLDELEVQDLEDRVSLYSGISSGVEDNQLYGGDTDVDEEEESDFGVEVYDPTHDEEKYDADHKIDTILES